MTFYAPSEDSPVCNADRASASQEITAAAQEMHSTLCASYVDGYHGGHVYGVPVGSWRDIVGAIRRNPDWALVFDLEPESWSEGLDEDPEALAELRQKMMEQPERFELVNHAFGQPYHWLCDAEWSYRHFLQGEALFRDLLPEMEWRVWAPQEPMWSSCMPGILRAMGYEAAVLKTPGTAFAGLAAGVDVTLLDWVGPDGSRLPAVPRYACEETRRTWETEARYLNRDFVEKCKTKGILNPVGTGLQDIGWRARPALPFKDSDLKREEYQYLTWSAYFDSLEGLKAQSKRYTLDDFRVGLPWGDAALDRVAEVARESEWVLRNVERVEALCVDPMEDRLDLGEWERAVLRAQHHDNWICARWREGEENFSRRTELETWNLRREGPRAITRMLRDAARESREDGRCVTLFNPLGRPQRRLLRVQVPIDEPGQSLVLEDEQGRQLPLQVERPQTSSDYSHQVNNHQVELVAEVELPACGTRSWTLRPGEALVAEGLSVTTSPHCVEVHGDRLGSVLLDARRGGAISSWKPARELINRIPEGESWGSFRGCIQGEAFDSATCEAHLRILEAGPCSVKIESEVEQELFTLKTLWSFSSASAWADVEVSLIPKAGVGSLQDPAQIIEGAPEQQSLPALCIGRRSGESDVRRLFAEEPSWFDNTQKLRMVLPMKGPALRCFREGPGDVGEARLLSEGVQRWKDLESETCVRWVDFEQEEHLGVACFTDRHTAFVHTEGEEPAVVMAWAGAPFAQREQMTRRFAILPHEGDWQESGLWNASREWEAALHTEARLLRGVAQTRSLLEVVNPDWELSSCRRCPEGLELRIYNSAPVESRGELRFPELPDAVWACTPRGQHNLNLTADLDAGRNSLPLSLPAHGWVTLRIAQD